MLEEYLLTLGALLSASVIYPEGCCGGAAGAYSVGAGVCSGADSDAGGSGVRWFARPQNTARCCETCMPTRPTRRMSSLIGTFLVPRNAGLYQVNIPISSCLPWSWTNLTLRFSEGKHEPHRSCGSGDDGVAHTVFAVRY